MPEALETWPVRLFEELLPRHLEIIYEINHRFLAEVRRRVSRTTKSCWRGVSLIDENGERRVRMAALAIVASHKVNGVSALHSELMVQTIFADYATLFPDRFINVTNGVTPRRWLMQANPELSALIDSPHRHRLAPRPATACRRCKPLAARCRRSAPSSWRPSAHNKVRLAELIRRELGIVVDPDSLFDVQIKRIHEYKRQLLNLLHVVARYQAIVDQPAGHGWHAAHRDHRRQGGLGLSHRQADHPADARHRAAWSTADPRVADRLKLVFLPNYSVSLAEAIIPAADLTEQISTAGTEASGTGNMKFAPQRRADHRHLGRRQHRDGAGHGRGRTCSCSACAPRPSREIKALGYDPRLHVEEKPPAEAR